MSEAYTYDNCPLKALGEIRLLTIQKGARNAEIECTLETRALAAKARNSHDLIPYEALSYHWGNEVESLDIRIYTLRPPAKRFKVRPNLYRALQQLRLPHESRALWVDAICIDQTNTGEKNSQVSVMADIYAEATRVCVWLGEGKDQSDLALDFISRVININDFDRLATDPNISKEWGALSTLMKRTWFSRRWVIQEIALARRATLYCGSAEVEWSDFAIAVSLFEAAENKGRLISKSIMNSPLYNHVPEFLGEIKSLGATRLVDATSNFIRKSKTGRVERLFHLDVLISNFAAFRASRPHDVIYAVLALSKGTHIAARTNTPAQTSHQVDLQQSIRTEPVSLSIDHQRLAKLVTKQIKTVTHETRFTVDYEKSFFDVCKDFLEFTVHHSKSLDIICRPWVPEDGFASPEKPPSWLLTMAQASFGPRDDGSYSRKGADTLVGIPSLNRRNYNASGTFEVTSEWRFGKDHKHRSMFVEGFIVESIRDKHASAMEGIIPYAWLGAGSWIDRSALPPEPFWRTLVADRGSNGMNPPAFYPLACKSALDKSVEGSNINTSTLVHSSKSEFVSDFLRRVLEAIWMRRLIVTSPDGMLGLGPDKARRKDIICILYGCSVPVILREMKDERRQDVYYEFIGECYVHGIMDGEAFDIVRARSENNEVEKQVFELR
ncbi:hypothetical protein MMC21_000025 [Puttea exsequens]|nr:hypothetical protein [Puttea exsequens]